MTSTLRGQQSQSALASALAWLDAPAAADALHDLSPLRHHLRAVAEAPMDPRKRLMLLGPFQKRTDNASRALKPRLREAMLPLPSRLRLIAQGLIEIHARLATTTLDAIANLTATQRVAAGRRLAEFCLTAVNNLAEQQLVALMVALAPPADLWQHAQRAYTLLKLCPSEQAATAERVFKAMLALAAAQPETFLGQEIGFLVEYLRCAPSGVTVTGQPDAALDAWYWLDTERPQPPVAVARRPPPADGKLLYFSCAALAQIAHGHLRRLGAGETPEALGLPRSLASDECRFVLHRAQTRWALPPRRRHHHRPSNYPVEICPELDQLWDLLRDTDRTDAGQDSLSLSKWTVMNESPGGFAMLHLSGALSGLASGGALGLRISPDRPWNVCVVRWARSNDADQVEVGLELVAPAAAPVHIVGGKGAGGGKLTPALLLRTGEGQHRNEALLTYRNGVVGHPFTMIAEPNGRVQLTECQVRRPALQTGSVEILEFLRDFSPSWN